VSPLTQGLRYRAACDTAPHTTPRNCTSDVGIKGRISRARGELAEDESPSFGQQGG